MGHCVHDFSAHTPATEEELRKNERETDEIQSTAKVASLWMVVLPNDCKSAEEVIYQKGFTLRPP
ncbi:MAG TPA: hypothetical protein P5056_02345, partial [Candidatus Paceibacterota bacterium]|nr:hypothetical protein [Candidatus Paceibacterota bacterium]